MQPKINYRHYTDVNFSPLDNIFSCFFFFFLNTLQNLCKNENWCIRLLAISALHCIFNHSSTWWVNTHWSKNTHLTINFNLHGKKCALPENKHVFRPALSARPCQQEHQAILLHYLHATWNRQLSHDQLAQYHNTKPFPEKPSSVPDYAHLCRNDAQNLILMYKIFISYVIMTHNFLQVIEGKLHSVEAWSSWASKKSVGESTFPCQKT